MATEKKQNVQIDKVVGMTYCVIAIYLAHASLSNYRVLQQSASLQNITYSALRWLKSYVYTSQQITGESSVQTSILYMLVQGVSAVLFGITGIKLLIKSFVQGQDKTCAYKQKSSKHTISSG